MGASHPMIRAASSQVPVGVAVQDGDYQHVNPRTSKEVTIGEIVQFGKEYLNVDYIFWCIEEPFYSERSIPFIKAQHKNGRRRAFGVLSTDSLVVSSIAVVEEE